MDQLRADLRTAFRALARRPGSALLVILTLAVGISTNTVMFSLFNGLLFKGAPYPARDRLAWIYAQRPSYQFGDLTYDEYVALRDATRAFDRVAVEARQSMTVTGQRQQSAPGQQQGQEPGQGRSEQSWALLVSDNYFATLGLTTSRGRLFGEVDFGGGIRGGRGAGEPPVVVTESFWRRRFGDEVAIAGKTVALNGRTFAIVGVLPDGARGFGGVFAPDLWAPLSAVDALGLRALLAEESGWLMAAGHLAPGATQTQAREELKALSPRIAVAPPLRGTARTFATFPMDRANPQTVALRPLSLVAMAGVGLVLLLACFNVAGVLLARAHERQREMGLRCALGATTLRLARQQMTELLVLATISGIAALIVGAWSYHLLHAFRLPSPIPQTVDMSLDWRMALFTIALVLLATVVPGFAPIWQSRALDVVRVLKADGRSSPVLRSPLRRGLLLAQIAGSTLLLALAGLLLASFVRVSASDPGFETRDAIVLDVDPGRYGLTGAAAVASVAAALDRLRAVPGVRAAAMTMRAPLAMGGDPVVPLATGSQDCAHADCPTAGLILVGPDYFDALGIPLISGAGFGARDAAAPREAIVVSRRVAEALWPGRNPVGSWLRLGKEGTLAQVRGVARDANHVAAADDRRGEIYRLMTPDDLRRGLQIVARTAGDPTPLLDGVRVAVRGVDTAAAALGDASRVDARHLPIERMQTMAGHLELPYWWSRTLAGFSLTCASIAVLLATVGLFGVVYRNVGQRQYEFGVRQALGAAPASLLRLVLTEGLRLAIPGVAAGLAIAVLLAHTARSLMPAVDVASPWTYLAVALLQAAATLAACLVPARRAATVDPLRVLRAD